MNSLQILLKPKSPFSFDLSARIFSNGDKQIRIYENGKFSQVISLSEDLTRLTLESVGNVEEPVLQLSLDYVNPISEEDKATEIAKNLFNMDFDLTPFYESVQTDRKLTHLIRMLRGLRSPTTQTVFEVLVDSIIEQQISLKVATSIEGE